MKNRFFTGVTILGLAALLFTSCAKIPQVEIDAANAAVELAKTAEAEIYVHESFVALQDSLNAAMVSIEAQKSKLFKNYTIAKEQLAAVTALAGEVKVQAETKKEEIKAAIQTAITEVKALIEANRELVTQAPKGKEGATALLEIKAEIDAIEVSINEVSAMFDAGNYMAANDKAVAAKEKATAINAELTEVIAKKGKK